MGRAQPAGVPVDPAPGTRNATRAWNGLQGVVARRQIHALNAASCTRIFADEKSGKDAEREELKKALDYRRDGERSSSRRWTGSAAPFKTSSRSCRLPRNVSDRAVQVP
ncbi:hypothetical protein GCM10010353_43470 [Streptomyces chryseus]|nr:hypothetical protein GCM10010353_43470 [Streptomyces chryseus]